MMECEVIVAGAGPVGLFLGCCLRKRGISCLVVEKSTGPSQHSRSIGIHPPSLEMLAELGLEDRFLMEGVVVKEGMVFSGKRHLGTLSFASCRKPFNFVLVLPQNRTEKILEEHFRDGGSGNLVRGAEVQKIRQEGDAVYVQAARSDGSAFAASGKFLVGCDGKASTVREAAGIPFRGAAYEDAFLLGDGSDSTDFGSAARIFLGPGGLVESFPLPGGMRRWVVRVSQPVTHPVPEDFCRLVKERAGQDILPATCHRLNAFGSQHYLASRWRAGRILLAGDAAHIMSPIGGQGMNVGWLDAWDLSGALERILKAGHPPDALLNAYERRGVKRARKAIRRAARNLSFAREHRWPSPHLLFIWLMLHTPLKHLFARLFTMRWL